MLPHLLLILASSAEASTPQTGPTVIAKVVECRSVASASDRLACFDREVAALDTAQAAGDLVTLDRQQVRKTRRSLFGLSLPDLGVLGDDKPATGADTQIESKLRSASRNALGKWTFELEDGARWVQLDTREFSIEPRAGHDIRIRRGAIGSYLANVNGQVAIRVRRLS